MSRSRDLANLAGDATGLETLTVSDITDLTATTTELNYVDGVTSAVQTQLNQLDSQTSPHIIPGVLYPAIGGKGIDGTTTVTSFGTDFAISGYPTLKYYYTDIKGSKPIKDPRIGGHFGSQRYDTRSLQLLEQETATHGSNVYSIDGREYLRAVSNGGDWFVYYNDKGNYLQNNVANGDFIEIVAYGNQLNMSYIWTANASHSVNRFDVYVDGVLKHDSPASALATVDRPAMNRYVNGASVLNLVDEADNVSCGLHTFKMLVAPAHQGNSYSSVSGIEIIAQDITSTANRSKIQIPSQDVVSYGKKFNVSGTPHYDPLTTMSYGGSGTTLSNLQSLIDTDTSLGMDAWKAGTSNYHRPWNGGRVIKWVDSSGTIKTSVNMMPPNAQNIGTTASNAVSDAHVIAGTNDDTINFNTSAIDHTQAEVAKTFHFREFGNGNANGGPHTGSENPPHADASMVTNSVDNIAYVMDDGCTSLSASGAEWNSSENFKLSADTNKVYITFIGTGLSIVNQTGTIRNVAQNLPYGTHIFSIERTSSSTGTATLDGIALQSTHANWDRGIIWSDITFHQPKKPPIPEDACILADYMLMADHVIRGAQGVDKISKGVRYISPSRDIFYDGGSWTFTSDPSYQSGLMIYGTSSSTTLTRATSFSTNAIKLTHNALARYQSWYTNDTAHSSADATTKVGANESSFYYPTATTLGNNTYDTFNVTADGNSAHNHGFEVVSPIHTSHHYQPFETPFLHELVGGDRNMEQTNLVCSPDGKTWDQITRDTSYLGNIKLQTRTDTDVSWADYVIFDEWRGAYLDDSFSNMNKDFAIAYDRIICLKNGEYNISYHFGANGTVDQVLYVNTGAVSANADNSTSGTTYETSINLSLSRGDYIRLRGEWGFNPRTMGDLNQNYFSITKI